LRTNPGHIVGNLVSCTGAQFCGLAIIETKNNAESIAKKARIDTHARILTRTQARIDTHMNKRMHRCAHADKCTCACTCYVYRALQVEECCEVDRSVRIHWTGCPNSCGQVQAADIGLMGGPAKKIIDGKAKAVPGVKMFIGGTIGEHGKLQLDADTEGIPIEDLTPFLVQAIVRDFGGRIRPEYAEQYAAWETEQANKKVADEAAAAAKEAKKAAAKAAA